MENENSQIEINKEPEAFAMYVDELLQGATNQRRLFERSWYDNNLFYDGYHFKYISRTTGKIVDSSKSLGLDSGMRAIPKAARQVRGVINLLLSPDYVPVVYPDELDQRSFDNPEMYEAEKRAYANKAKSIGLRIQDQWETLNMNINLMQMMLLAAKNSVGYLKIFGDYDKEEIKVVVKDAWDLYLPGSYTELEKVPYIIEVTKMPIKDIQANEKFDLENRMALSADNKYAASEVKQAYMNSRYGNTNDSSSDPTILQKEVWIKTIITEKNRDMIIENASEPEMMEKRGPGDVVMRHAFVAGGFTLLDEYLDEKEYPYVDYRFEPGNLYQTAFIENFIPLNKSLDIITSRVERIINSMVVGTWITRAGEDITFSNIPGGQKITYKGTPPVQGAITSVPNYVFTFIELISSMIEEQGASTAALGQLPNGIRSGTAIESLKATEYANLKIPTEMLKNTVLRIARKMANIESDFISIKRSSFDINGTKEPYAVIGERGQMALEKSEKMVPDDVAVIKKDIKVDIEVEGGMGFTMQGKKETMQKVVDFIQVLAQNGLITQPQVMTITKRFLDIYEFGATQEFMDGVNEGTTTAPVTEEQLQQVKIALAEVIKDLDLAGSGSEQKMVEATKVGMMEVMKDLQS